MTLNCPIPSPHPPRWPSCPGPPAFDPLDPGDVTTVRAVLESLSVHSAYLRFHTGLGRIPARMAQTLATVTPGYREVYVARAGDHPIGLAHWTRHPRTADADLALVVVDSWAGRGVGRGLAARAAASARGAGVRAFVADVLAENQVVQAWLASSGAVRDRKEPSRWRVELHPK